MSPDISTLTDTADGREDSTDTRERLIVAGMEVFAERGFADASVRQICKHAGANTAAVNYHFGDKQSFYAEVLATCHLRAVRRRPLPRLADDPDHPERVLGAFIRWFLELLIVDGAGPLGRLMAREMADPTPALDQLTRRSLLPIMVNLQEILVALTPDWPLRRRFLVQKSIMGQCLFYRFTQPAMDRFRAVVDEGGTASMPPGLMAKPDLPELSRHITEFSLAGIRAVGSSPGEDSDTASRDGAPRDSTSRDSTSRDSSSRDNPSQEDVTP